ncbi:hypothetical protein O0I10_010264 [Lichtheimia ornata]|uniref:Velvet domain-containing protein n=1 Tax=Lichtheimia ornata TaxID=688661 RepID=A0AAD7XV23_9FUNG|nr:uncharacterized protein O0I10_010264 [Lichtheimia ornata]KAJ8654053.1 hypothetical protein O0I10_010264 [Lichtheimia ornata]
MSTHHSRSQQDRVPASLRKLVELSANQTINQYQNISSIELVVRQQPVKARLCSFKEKVDRRPVDPPPIVQLICRDPDDQSYLHDPYFFLYATLATTDGQDLHFMNGTRTTAGSVVQSLHKLKDIDDKDGGFFIFADISVRHEGFFKLKFTLFKIIEQVSHVLFSLHSRLTRKIFFSRLYNRTHVYRLCSAFSDAFQVYSPKTFPGMSESTFLTRCFSDQGVRIRIRKETRTPSNHTKRRRTEEHEYEDNDDRYRSSTASQSDVSHAMSMQNLLRSDSTPTDPQHPPPPPPPLSSTSEYYHRLEPTTTAMYRSSLQLPPIQQSVPRDPHFPASGMLSTSRPIVADHSSLYNSSSSSSSSSNNYASTSNMSDAQRAWSSTASSSNPTTNINNHHQ